MSNEKIEFDDYVRWLGKQRPVALAWLGLAILQVSAAIFICVEAYIRYAEFNSQYETSVQDVLEIMAEKYKQKE